MSQASLICLSVWQNSKFQLIFRHHKLPNLTGLSISFQPGLNGPYSKPFLASSCCHCDSKILRSYTLTLMTFTPSYLDCSMVEHFLPCWVKRLTFVEEPFFCQGHHLFGCHQLTAGTLKAQCCILCLNLCLKKKTLFQ